MSHESAAPVAPQVESGKECALLPSGWMPEQALQVILKLGTMQRRTIEPVAAIRAGGGPFAADRDARLSHALVEARRPDTRLVDERGEGAVTQVGPEGEIGVVVEDDAVRAWKPRSPFERTLEAIMDLKIEEVSSGTSSVAERLSRTSDEGPVACTSAAATEGFQVSAQTGRFIVNKKMLTLKLECR